MEFRSPVSSDNAPSSSQGCSGRGSGPGWRIDWTRSFPHQARPTSDVSPADERSAALSETIRTCAGKCAGIIDDMDNFAGGRRGASLLAKPAFVELVLLFSREFTELTAAVDSADHPDPATGDRPQQDGSSCASAARPIPWRHLVADQRVLAALEAGIAAANAHVVSRAVERFVAENPGCLDRH